MPNEPRKPNTAPASPNQREERELEDRVGRRPDAQPDLVPPGTIGVDRDQGLGKSGGSGASELEDGEGLDEALIADRENARTSDRNDARDGVDNSDTLAIDPDAAGGKGPR